MTRLLFPPCSWSLELSVWYGKVVLRANSYRRRDVWVGSTEASNTSDAPSTALGWGQGEGEEGFSWTSESSEANRRHKETDFVTNSSMKCVLDRCAV